MNPNDRITPDNINNTASEAPVNTETPAQEQAASPFVAPAQPAVAAEVAPTPPAAPVQAAPTQTAFASPTQMVQRVANPDSNYYREDENARAHQMRDILHAQPKAWTMIPLQPGEKPESMLPVGINGYFVYIRKGVMVEVPMQIAQMVADSFNQDRLIGAEHDLSLNEDKQRALQR